MPAFPRCLFAFAIATAVSSALAQLPAADAPRDAMVALGKQHASAEALFAWLKQQANGSELNPRNGFVPR